MHYTVPPIVKTPPGSIFCTYSKAPRTYPARPASRRAAANKTRPAGRWVTAEPSRPVEPLQRHIRVRVARRPVYGPRGRGRSPADPARDRSTRLPRARPSTVPARPGPAGLGVGQGSKRTREGSLQQPFLRLSPLAPAASQSCVPSQARPPGRPHSRSGCGGGGRRRIWCGQFRRHFGGDAKHGTVKGLASAEAPEAPDPAHRHPHACPAHPPEPSPAHPPRCRIRKCGWGWGAESAVREGRRCVRGRGGG